MTVNRRSFLKGAMAAAGGLAGVSVFGGNAGGTAPIGRPYAAIVPGLAADGDASEPVTLRGWGDRAGIEIGVFLTNKTPQALEIEASDFNLGDIYVGWPYSEPEPGKFNLTSLNYFTKFARQNAMTTWAGNLVWPHDLPDWVKSGRLPKAQLIEVIQRHVAGLMTPFRGIVPVWRVVNETYNPPYFTNDIFQDVIGPEYVDIAFRAARQSDPDATLIYNGFDNHSAKGIGTQVTTAIVQRLKADGLIDGVGVEMHINGAKAQPSSDDIITTLRSYGLPVYITELDVNIKDVPGTRDERFLQQADIYRTTVESVLRSGVCRSILVFGVRDSDSVWETQATLADYSPVAQPLLFDDNFHPKPAYFAMRDVLRSAALRH